MSKTARMLLITSALVFGGRNSLSIAKLYLHLKVGDRIKEVCKLITLELLKVGRA